MARMMAEPGMVSLTHRPGRKTVSQGRSAARPPVSIAAPPTVLGDRVGGARPKTHVVRRNNRSVGREMLTVLFASFVVSLLCFYVSAYARVTAETFQGKRLAEEVRKAELHEQNLRATISEFTAWETIRAHAEKMGMVQESPTNVDVFTPKGVAGKAPMNGPTNATVPEIETEGRATP